MNIHGVIKEQQEGSCGWSRVSQGAEQRGSRRPDAAGTSAETLI